MKKDENIERMLEKLSEAQDTPKLELLLPAIREQQRQRSMQAGGAGNLSCGKRPVAARAGVAAITKKKRVRIAVIASIIVFIIATAIAIPQIFNAVISARTFALTALETSNDVTAAQKELFPVLNHESGDAVIAEYTVLSNSGDTVAVQYKARRLTKYAVEDITIIAETDKYFIAEYQKYAKNTAYNKNGNKYCYSGYYSNGEYCAEYYASAGDIRYYFNIISPKESNKSYYLEKLLEIF